MTNSFDLSCPKCGDADKLDINANIWVRLDTDGTDADLAANRDHEWDDDSLARCAACGHSGKVTDFRQNEYMAYFRTTAGPVNDIFAADTPERALELARKAFAEDPGKLGFSPADSGFLELQEIRLVNDDADEVLLWMTDEYRLQLHAPELLKALESQVNVAQQIIDAHVWDNTDRIIEAVHGLIGALEAQRAAARSVLDRLDAWESGNLEGAVSEIQDSLTAARKTIADAKGGAA